MSVAELSATFRVGGALARVGGEIDLIINRITGQNIKKWGKVGGANDVSRWRNRPAPPLADNPDCCGMQSIV